MLQCERESNLVASCEFRSEKNQKKTAHSAEYRMVFVLLKVEATMTPQLHGK